MNDHAATPCSQEPERIELDTATIIIAPVVQHPGKSSHEDERETVRAIIEKEFGHTAVLCHKPSGAPYLDGMRDISISISHCRTHACIAHSTTASVGVDIENPRQQLQRIAPRFLSPAEREAYNTPTLLLQAWTIKEALYKAALTPGLDLRRDIGLPIPPECTWARVGDAQFTVALSLERAGFMVSLVTSVREQN